ncbi:MAG TPA: hypothetical protein VGC80_02165 [Acetobacteraceae bacterium]
METRNTIALIWIIGLLVALAAYLVGPENLVGFTLDAIDQIFFLVGSFVRELSRVSIAVIRALAVGLFVTFVALAILGIRRGRRVQGALVVVSALFLWLIWDGYYASNGRWTAAFILAAIAALSMTNRLRGP